MRRRVIDGYWIRVKAGDTSILDQSEGRRPSIAVFIVK